MTDSWILKAIEDAAMERARRTVLDPPQRVLGLTIAQWLVADYVFRTGNDPTMIDPERPHRGCQICGEGADAWPLRPVCERHDCPAKANRRA